MNHYTVIGEYPETGKILAIHVDANNSQHAMYLVAEMHPAANISAAINGHLSEGNGIEFAGESVVDASTILEQEEIFNRKDDLESCGMQVLADFTIKDWHTIDESDARECPVVHQTPYRMIITQSPQDNRVLFKVFPEVIDKLIDEEDKQGLYGCIEIHEGLPGISLGLSEESSCLHVETDIHSGFFVHTDGDIEPRHDSWKSTNYTDDFNGLYFKFSNGAWLDNTRRKVAENAFDSHDFSSIGTIEAHNGWEVFDGEFKKTVFYEDFSGGDSIKGTFSLEFAKGSIYPIEIRSS